MTPAQRRLVEAMADAVAANGGKSVAPTAAWWAQVGSQHRTLVACLAAGYLRRRDDKGTRYWWVGKEAYRQIGREVPVETRGLESSPDVPPVKGPLDMTAELATVELPADLLARINVHAEQADIAPADLVAAWCEWGLIMDQTGKPDPEYTDSDLLAAGCRLLLIYAVGLSGEAMDSLWKAQAFEHAFGKAVRLCRAAAKMDLLPTRQVPPVEMDLLRRALTRAGEIVADNTTSA